MSEQQPEHNETQRDQALAVQDTTAPQEIGDISFDVLISPREIIAQSQEQAKALMEVVEQMKLYQSVRGRKFLQVEAWQLIGQFTNTRAIPDEPTQIDDPDRIRYKCTVTLKDQAGEIVGSGSAEAHNKEEGKARLTENQIASTAQTRAISKAYRNKYGFVAKLAGFEATTAEEMSGAQQPPAPASKPQPPAAPTPAQEQPQSAEGGRSARTAAEPTPTATTPPQSTPEELKAYIECKEKCLEFVDTDIFIETAIGLGYEGKKPSTLIAEELKALLDACMKLKAKADEPEPDEPIEPFPTPTNDEEQTDEEPTEDETPF